MSLPSPVVFTPSKIWDGNDGLWSTFMISVGTPGQAFRVLMSTATSSIYLPLNGVCPTFGPTNCLDSRGILPFRGRNSIGFQTSQSSSWDSFGLYLSNREADLGLDFNATYGSDTVQLGLPSDSNALIVTDQNVGSYVDDRFCLGFFGLNPKPESFGGLRQSFNSFFGTLKLTLAPSYSYSYSAGAAHQNRELFASFIVGGYDTTRFKPSGVTFNFREFQDAKSMLTVGVQSITSTHTLKGDLDMTHGFLSAIDSTVSQLWLPDDVCDKFVEAFNLKYDNSTKLFLVDDSTHKKLLELDPQFTFRLSNDLYSSSASFVNIVLPYAAFDLQASYPIYDKPTNYFPIRRARSADSYTLGRAFLQHAYLIVNYGNETFSVDQAVFPDPVTQPNIVTIYPPGYSASSNVLRGGAIAGIIVGLCSGAILLGITAWLLWRRKKQRREELLDSKIFVPPDQNGPQELASNHISRAMCEIGTEGSLYEMPGVSSSLQEIQGDPKATSPPMIGSSA